jgi:hypothetical protein
MDPSIMLIVSIYRAKKHARNGRQARRLRRGAGKVNQFGQRMIGAGGGVEFGRFAVVRAFMPPAAKQWWALSERYPPLRLATSINSSELTALHPQFGVADN